VSDTPAIRKLLLFLFKSPIVIELYKEILEQYAREDRVIKKEGFKLEKRRLLKGKEKEFDRSLMKIR